MKRMTIKSFIGICLVTMASNGAYAQSTTDKVRMVSGEDVVLTQSWLKEREELNTNYLMSIGTDRLLHNFRLQAGLSSSARALGGWEDPGCGLRGHFTGHYLSALSTLVSRYHDTKAEARLKQLVDGLAKCQNKFSNGYLGAIPESDFETLERTYGNVWAPYYTLHKILQGLVDAYVKTGNEQALEVACKSADWVYGRMSKLSAETLEGMFKTDQANPGNEHGGMNEVLEQLYSITKNEKYLTTAKMFDRDWFVDPLAKGEDNLSGLHSNTHIILIGGFVRRYENTGEEKYRDAAINFWDILMRDHVYANGTSSGPRPVVTTATSRTAEHWGNPGKLANTLSGEIAESCVTHNTQRLNNYLFQWTADPKYADEAMNTFFNATLACQNHEDGRVTYHMPLGSPRHKSWLGEEDFRCCNGSSIEAFAGLNNNIYYVDDTNVYINNYLPSEMTWREKGVKLTQSGGFPFTPDVDIVVNCEKTQRFALNLLIPSWADEVSVVVNTQEGEVMNIPGQFLTLDRKWKDGDKVSLRFDYKFRIKSMPDNADKCVIFHGPLMLAFLGDEAIELPESADELLSQISGNPTDGYTLKSAIGEYRLKPLCDILYENYSCYVMKEQKNSPLIRTIDNVIIGNGNSENAHSLQNSSGSNSGDYNGKTYRDSERGGFVQYILSNTKGETENVSLMLCFTTADKGRVATAYIDDVKIADVAVPDNVKTADERGFYNIEYPIPSSLLTDEKGEAKKSVVFKIVATGNTQIPGLYDVRLLNNFQDISYRFVATDWKSGDEARVMQSQISYDTEANTITMDGVRGNNNVCLMLNADAPNYTINADQQYLVVQASNISAVDSKSALWWLNGIGQGNGAIPSYRKKMTNGDILIGWKLSASGVSQNVRGDRCQITTGNTIFGLTNSLKDPVIKYIGFVTSPADYIASNINNIYIDQQHDASSANGTYDIQGRNVTNPSKGIYIVNGKKVMIN